MEHAMRELRADEVDVNEQNPAAVGFYQHFGFKVVGRSPLDGTGKPFPILHMALERAD
jgi:putative acetyltransferase